MSAGVETVRISGIAAGGDGVGRLAWARRRPTPRTARFIAGRAEEVLQRLPAPHAVIQTAHVETVAVLAAA